jgi:hypothetical protein
MNAKVVLFVCVGLAAGVAPARVVRADAATEQARRHYLKGNEYFDLGRWNDAVEEYERGYAIRNDPSFLYNMAQSYRRKGEAKRALDLYKNYLIKAPKSPQRPEVEERIRALQKQLEEGDAAAKTSAPPSVTPPPQPATVAPPAPAPSPSPAVAPTSPGYGTGPASSGSPSYVAPVTTPTNPPAGGGYGAPADASQNPYLQTAPEPTTKPGHGLRVGGVICGVAGVAFVGGGIAFGAMAKSYSDSVQSGAVFNPNFDERGKLYEALQWVGYGIGGGLIAVGAVLYGIGAASSSKATLAIAPTVLPGGAGFSAGGTF